MLDYVIVDIESTKKPNHLPWKDGAYLVCVGVKKSDGTSDIFWFNHDHLTCDHGVELARLRECIGNAKEIVAHNLKFDLTWLKYSGLEFLKHKFFCTMVAEYLINGQRKIPYDLSSCARRYGLPVKLDAVKEMWEQGMDTNEIPTEVLTEYLLQDLNITEALYLKQRELISSYELSRIADLSFTVSDILSDMELTGVMFDEDAARKYHAEYVAKMDRIDQKVFQLVGRKFNLGSSEQLSAVLFGGTIKEDGVYKYTVTLKSGLVKERSRKVKVDTPITGVGFTPIPGTETSKVGVFSTDKNVLKQLEPKSKLQRMIKKLLIRRSVFAKIISTFLGSSEDGGLLNKVCSDGLIHPSFNQTVTATGRLSSSNPNGQNLPRKGTSPIKKTFVSRLGKIVNVDLKQIEHRIAASLSMDPVMLAEIHSGIDAHGDNAEKIFGADRSNEDAFDKVRTTAKIMTFRLLYGGSAAGFFKDSKMPAFSLERWKEIVDAYWKKYTRLKAWQQEMAAEMHRQGYIRNPSGRILGFVQQQQRDGSYGFSERHACNYPVQSGSADIYYLALAVLRKRLRDLALRSKIILLVHDSIVLDCPDDEVDIVCREAIKIFEDLPRLADVYWGWKIHVPLSGDCEVGPTYGTTAKYEDWKQ